MARKTDAFPCSLGTQLRSPVHTNPVACAGVGFLPATHGSLHRLSSARTAMQVDIPETISTRAKQALTPVGLPQIFRRGLHHVVIIAMQHFLQRRLGSHSGPDAIED